MNTSGQEALAPKMDILSVAIITMDLTAVHRNKVLYTKTYANNVDTGGEEERSLKDLKHMNTVVYHGFLYKTAGSCGHTINLTAINIANTTQRNATE